MTHLEKIAAKAILCQCISIRSLEHHTKSLGSSDGTTASVPLVTKQLLGNVFKTFQNGWILVEMLSLYWLFLGFS